MSTSSGANNDPQNKIKEDSLINSTMGTSSFYSINDSDFENMNVSTNELDPAQNKTLLDNTLQGLSESTINFILDEQLNNENLNNSNNSSIGSGGKPSAASAAATAAGHQHVIVLNETQSSSDEIIIISSDEESFADNEDDEKSPSKADKTIDLAEQVPLIPPESIKKEKLDRSDDVKNANQAATIEQPPPPISGEIKIYNSLSEFDKNLPHTIRKLTTPFGSEVYLVGTAHFSHESEDDVSLAIRNVQPDIVMVELCSSRVHILKHDEKTLLEEASDINLAKIQNTIKTNGPVNGLFYIVLLKMSANITKTLGMAPGGEFRRALKEVREVPNCVFQLGDRPVGITLKRALHGLSWWQTIKICYKLITTDEKITKEDVEQCKQTDLLEKLMNEMADDYPAFHDVFVTERDLYLCHSLQVAAMPQAFSDGKTRPVKVVGVVGIGHCAGIASHWGKVDSNRIPEITSIPPTSLSSRLFRCTLKYGILGLIGYGVYRVVRPRIANIL